MTRYLCLLGFIIGAVLGSPLRVFAEQEDDPENLIYWDSDADVENARDAGEISVELSEELQELIDNPLDINQASARELAVLPGVSADAAEKIVNERESAGEFEKPEELVARSVISPETFQKIRLFIAAGPSLKWLHTRGELRQEFFTSPYDVTVPSPGAEGMKASSLNMRSRIKGVDGSLRFRAGGTFLTDSRTFAQSYGDQNGLKVFSAKDARWAKTYGGYDPPASKKSWLRQVYFGNYRAGFFEGLEKERPSRFYPDERLTAASSVEPDPEKRRAAPLRGAALQAGAGYARFSAYFSRDDYPVAVPVAYENGVAVSSRTVDDSLSLEMSGGHVSLPLGPDAELSGFWSRVAASRKWGSIIPHQSPIWGAELRGVLGRFQGRAVFSRSEVPLAGRDRSNFYFARAAASSDSGTYFAGSYKRLDRGYWNPAGSFFTGNFIWRFSGRIYQDLSDAARLRLEYAESEKMIGGLALRRQEAAFQLRLEPVRELTALWGETYRSPGPVSVAKSLNDDGTLKSVRIDAADDLRSSLRLIHQTMKKFETRLGWDVLASKKEGSDEIETAQFLTAGILYRLLEELHLRVQADFSDPGWRSSNNETQSWLVELRSRPSRSVDIRLRWRNRYRLRTETVGAGNEEFEADVPQSEDFFSLCATVRW